MLNISASDAMVPNEALSIFGYLLNDSSRKNVDLFTYQYQP